MRLSEARHLIGPVSFKLGVIGPQQLRSTLGSLAIGWLVSSLDLSD